MRGLPKYFMIFLGLLSLAILSHAFSTEKREVSSNFFNVNAAVHPDLKGKFDTKRISKRGVLKFYLVRIIILNF